MQPGAMGCKAWLFADGKLAGQHAAVVMSLMQPIKLKVHDPWACQKRDLDRLPTHLNNQI